MNFLTSLVEENANWDFIDLWNESKEEIFEMIKKLEKKSVKPKKKKDDNAPKKNVSAWILFCRVERPKIKAEFPDMKPKRNYVSFSCKMENRKGRRKSFG